jgi:predicted metalloprotease
VRTVTRSCAAALACTALLAAGCGDDEEKTGGGGGATTTERAGALLEKDVQPKAAAPNVKGAGDDIRTVATKFAGEAAEYLDKVFEQNGKTYRRPQLIVADAPAQDACGAFDPEKQGVFLCFSPDSDRLTMGAQYLERAREEAGDAAAVFLIGYGVSLSGYDQLTGDRLAKGGTIDEEFVHAAACLAGAWNRWMTKQRLFEEGDEQELLKLAERLIPGQTEEGVSLGQDIVAAGFLKGASACTTQEGNR